MVNTPKPAKQLAAWGHANTIWKMLQQGADEDDIYRGNLSELFYEHDIIAHRARVMRALKLMGRVEVLTRSTGSRREVTQTKIYLRNADLSIHDFEKVIDDVYGTTQHRTATKKWLTDQRISDLAQVQGELLMRVEALERRLDGRPPITSDEMLPPIDLDETALPISTWDEVGEED